MKASKENMPEKMYRASRCCRVIGNPTAYLTIRSLAAGRKSPTELSDELDIPLPTVSMTLRHLRQIDLVRYETRGTRKNYRLKDRKIVKALDALEEWGESVRAKRG